jgi:hypothetical protein
LGLLLQLLLALLLVAVQLLLLAVLLLVAVQLLVLQAVVGQLPLLLLLLALLQPLLVLQLRYQGSAYTVKVTGAARKVLNVAEGSLACCMMCSAYGVATTSGVNCVCVLPTVVTCVLHQVVTLA